MNAYCDRQSVEINSIAFLFDGRRLRAEQTPDEVPELPLHFILQHMLIWFIILWRKIWRTKQVRRLLVVNSLIIINQLINMGTNVGQIN